MTAVVYWLLDAEDNVLYVGCTKNIRQRMENHSSVKAWWPSVASVAHTDYMPRSEALDIEREDTITLRPVHNVQNKGWFAPSALLPTGDFTDLIGSLEATTLLGINRSTFNRWAKKGILPIEIQTPSKVGARLFHRADITALAKKRAA